MIWPEATCALDKIRRPSFPHLFWSQTSLHETCTPHINTVQGAGFGPRIGKPAKIRHCPRNGKIVMGRNSGHWAGGAREGVALGPGRAAIKSGNQPWQRCSTAGGGHDAGTARGTSLHCGLSASCAVTCLYQSAGRGRRPRNELPDQRSAGTAPHRLCAGTALLHRSRNLSRGYGNAFLPRLAVCHSGVRTDQAGQLCHASGRQLRRGDCARCRWCDPRVSQLLPASRVGYLQQGEGRVAQAGLSLSPVDL